ncbi:uncharacterized protein LOC141676959 isoform X2 [Apium graveolens]|uniref:uncharacterized protein LOC141676959 isoform X2 n=1 Tax=Apium graveolens TaxID=4045 RepID=UPI003D78D7E8
MLEIKDEEKKRDDQEQDSSSGKEDYDEEFKCCICLDLVYKPVVLECGHMSCFWCVYNSMGEITTSSCPVCRHTYDHFPRICKMLHYVILDLYPAVYKRRELQVKEEEEKRGKFSPHLWHIKYGKKLDEHLLCASCNRLLYQPVVLNCGHVHCEECIHYQLYKCPVCECLQPNGFVNKCFALEHLIRLHLPEEFEERKLSSLWSTIRQRDSTEVQKHNDEVATVHCANLVFPAWVTGDGPVVHYKSGCDHCGMLPVTGNRYHCRDCNGTSGFDLCGECYENSLNLPGRFNQEHNSKHEFNKISGSRISYAGFLQINENTRIITPYITEECLEEEGESKKWISSKGSSDYQSKCRSSKGPSDDESKSMRTSTGPSHQLLVTFKNNLENFEMRRCLLSELVDHNSCVSIDLDYPKKPHRCIEIVSSCKGLVCFVFDEEFVILWNPSTEKFRELPTYDPDVYGNDAYLVYGFGYDAYSKDFKVVSILCHNSGLNTYETDVRVFGLKSGKWRQVEAFPFGVVPNIPYGPLDYPGQFTNGSLHWLTTQSTISSPIIVSFNLKSERFGVVLQPIYDLLNDTEHTLLLGTLRHSLCVFCNYEDTRADLWIQNEYGVKDSWTKLLSMPALSAPPALLYMSEKRDIVFGIGSNIVVYSCEDGKFKVVEIPEIADCDCFEATTYTESMFPCTD